MTFSIGAFTRCALVAGLAAGVCMAGAQGAVGRDEVAGGNAPRAIEITARALRHFQPSRPKVRRFGDLEFRGGLVLTSPSESFGGWSGIALDADGKRLLAVSDAGDWLSADIAYDEDGAPAALTDARIGTLQALSGRTLRGKREQDAESVAIVDGSPERGTLLIGFERLHRVGLFPVRGGRLQRPARYLRRPRRTGSMSRNQGFEAVAVLRAGRFRGSPVAFAERYTRGSGYHTGWIWVDGRPQRFQVRDLDGFNITDAAALPDGGLLILERYFRWTEGIHMRIRRLAADEIKPGARLTGQVVVRADSGYEIDNMEGLAVHRGRRGETVVSLISDNNFNRFLQRTVLLQFELTE